MAPADDPLHGQGRRRQDVGRRRHRPPLRRRGRAHARALHRSRALARRRRCRRAVGGAPTDVGERPVRPAGPGPGRARAPLVARCSDWLGGVLMERGVDRIAAEELTVPPGGDELFSLLALKAHARVRRLGRDRRRLRADRRDAAAAVVPGRRAAGGWTRCSGASTSLLAAARPLARTFLDVQLPDERVVRRGPAARRRTSSRCTSCCATPSASRCGS